MKKNKMLSLAAAMVLTSTAAMAFDTNTTTIQTLSGTTVIEGGYKNGGSEADDNLTKSSTQYGDALVYPAYQSADGWSTDFTVRNTSSDNAVVAKAVFYSADKSEELLDFNIYLSVNDVFKFNITDGVVTTTDGSVVASESVPNTGADTATMQIDGGTPLDFTSAVAAGKIDTEGYVVVYGMAQASADDNATTGAGKYHEKHKELWADYRALLDECRGSDFNNSNNAAAITDGSGWRQAWDGQNLVNGMFTLNTDTNFTAPNVDVNDTCGQDDSTRIMFEGVDPVLLGAVRMTTSTSASRDVMMPATAFENFTEDGKMVLWATGEFAAFADRDINATGDYNKTKVWNDAQSLVTETINLEFDKTQDEETIVLVTQPFKRNLVQLFPTDPTANPTGYSNVDLSDGIFDGYYGDFKITGALYDLKENGDGEVTVGEKLIVSPANGTAATDPDVFKNELQIIELDKDLLDKAVDFDSDEGYINITGFEVSGIVTQMNGSRSTGDAQTNWTLTPVK